MVFVDPNHYLITLEYTILFILSVSTILSFRKMNIDVIKARVFLNKGFLFKNFSFIITAGLLLGSHEMIEIAYENGFLASRYHIFSEGLENMSLIFLILWVYTWWKLRTK